jgi:nicotinate-nucleotide pyrophosphorylase (carboxylating)
VRYSECWKFPRGAVVDMKDNASPLPPLYPMLYEEAVRRALQEDLGRAGDITTDAIVPLQAQASALMIARQGGRIAGIDVAVAALRCLDPTLRAEIQIHDGEDSEAGETVALLTGNARALLIGERTALNFLGHMSGIATVTRDIVAAISSHHAKVVCTRKTTPGLRALEKYSVRAGGGANHRFGLDDAVLIKDNHRLIAGSVTEAVRRVRRHVGHMVKIEVEVDTLAELEEALALSVDAILFDNMPPDLLLEGVRTAKGRVITEASGGITPITAPAIAATGVDLLSVGWITHSAPSLDVALDLAPSL